MHNEKEQEMTSPVSHSEDAQSAMQGKNWGMVALCAPTIEGPNQSPGDMGQSSPARES